MDWNINALKIFEGKKEHNKGMKASSWTYP